MDKFKNGYDLEERTAKFGEEIITFCRTVKKDPIIFPVITQLIRSATSIGANYMEANGASSPKDFSNKIYICKKEALESKHWLRMLKSYYPDQKEHLKRHWQEAHEFSLIFHKIVTTLKNKNLKINSKF